ncbi:MAG: DUF1015 domain-containing protein [Aureispira sp.]|nr:DUF1015 domain-containing protein [Aureispira sp.]
MATIAPFRAALPDLTDIISFDDFFGSAKRKFPLYLSDGIYEQEPNEALYIYRIKRSNRSYTGLLACTSVEDYIGGKIKKHENTLAVKEAKMMRLFKERNALIKPILLTYPNELKIDALINRITASTPPSFVIPFQDEEHIFWKLEEKIRIQTITKMFEELVPTAYICDGHHRAKTSEILYKQSKEGNTHHTGDEPYNNMLVAYFPASEIEIHNYNRILADLGVLTPDGFLEELKRVYHIYGTPKAVQPIAKHQLGLYLDKQWYKLVLKEEFMPTDYTPTNESLDVHLLNKHVLEEILGIHDVREEQSIRYLEGPKGAFALERRVREGKAAAAFNLYPVALEDLITISDEGGTLPPKSTWIDPRMRNGFIAQLYSDL